MKDSEELNALKHEVVSLKMQIIREQGRYLELSYKLLEIERESLPNLNDAEQQEESIAK